MTTLSEIEARTKRYAEARELLAGYVQTLNDMIEQLKRVHMTDIKRAVNRAAEREAELRFCVETAPHLFEKPRTVIFHGVKVGFQKGKGSISIPDPDYTMERLEKIFGDQAAGYLRIKKYLDKEALAGLPAADLKKLGCTVTDTGDEVVIKPTDTAVDKIVNALLKDAVEEATN